MDGIELCLISNADLAVKCSGDMALFYVIAGTVTAAMAQDRWRLKKNDVIVFNIGDSWQIAHEPQALVLQLCFPGRKLLELLKDSRLRFSCNSVADRIHSYQELQSLLQRLVLSFVGKKKHTDCLQHGFVYLLLDCLAEQFRPELKADPNGTDMKNDGSAERKKAGELVRSIIAYVSGHYQDPIRLQELAEQMFVSTATLSRSFHKETGIYFADYVNRIRLEEAVRRLESTEQAVTRIAYDCGFSSLSSFHRNFRQRYKMTPKEWRKEQEGKEDREKEQEEWEQMVKQIADLNQSETQGLCTRMAVKVSANEGGCYQRFWGQVVNVGAISVLAEAGMREHILFLKEQLGFQYARIWNIFSRPMMIRGNHEDNSYNFNLIDEALDFLVQHNLIPFLDLGARPDEAFSSEGTKVYDQKQMMLFAGLREWEQLRDAFLDHLIRRYGRENVSNWRFEFFVYELKECCFLKEEVAWEQLYESCFRSLKKRVPHARIGARGFMADSSMEEISSWMEDCRRKQVVPDFLTMLAFPYIRNEENGSFVARRDPRTDAAAEQAERLRAFLDQNGYQSCALYLTEWNETLSNRNYINDSCVRAVALLRLVNRLWGIPQCLAVWMASNRISTYYDTVCIANGGSGMITKDGIRKPIFYALRFLNQMGGRLIRRGENYLITRDDLQENFFVLCYNWKKYGAEYYLREEDSFKPEEIYQLFEPNERLKLEITIEDLPKNRELKIKQLHIGPGAGSILEEWKRFAYERELEKRDIQYVKEICIPSVDMRRASSADGKLCLQVELEAHGFLLIHIFFAD